MPNGFSYFLPDGTPVTGDPNAPLPGTPYYQSAVLNDAGTATTEGDVFNRFKGLTTAEGGGFGGGPSADALAARKAWESVSGVSGDKLGDTSGWDAAKWDATRRTFGGIANQDRQTTMDALASDNPFIKATAQRYAQNNGWAGSLTPAQGTTMAITPDSTTDPFAPFTENAMLLQGGVRPRTDPALLPTPDPTVGPQAPLENFIPASTGPIDRTNFGGYGAPPVSPGWGNAPQNPSAMRSTAGSGSAFGRRFGLSGAAPSLFQSKYRQRFKPLGAPTNGFMPTTAPGVPK